MLEDRRIKKWGVKLERFLKGSVCWSLIYFEVKTKRGFYEIK